MPKLIPVIENVAMKFGLIPIEIEFQKESGKWFLRIYIYSNDHAISHEDCENLTRGLDNYLDELIPVKYYIEVSSPGLDRKIKSIKEYEIFKGKMVKIKLKKELQEGTEKVFLGKIVNFQKNIGLTVLPENSEEEIIIEEDNISSARLYYE